MFVLQNLNVLRHDSCLLTFQHDLMMMLSPQNWQKPPTDLFILGVLSLSLKWSPTDLLAQPFIFLSARSPSGPICWTGNARWATLLPKSFFWNNPAAKVKAHEPSTICWHMLTWLPSTVYFKKLEHFFSFSKFNSLLPYHTTFHILLTIYLCS